MNGNHQIMKGSIKGHVYSNNCFIFLSSVTRREELYMV